MLPKNKTVKKEKELKRRRKGPIQQYSAVQLSRALHEIKVNQMSITSW